MIILTNTQSAGHHIGIAIALLRRGKLVRGLDVLSCGLKLYVPSRAKRQEKFEVEILLEECLGELSRLPQVRILLAKQGIPGASHVHVAYTRGEEARLQSLLQEMRETMNTEQDQAH